MFKTEKLTSPPNNPLGAGVRLLKLENIVNTTLYIVLGLLFILALTTIIMVLGILLTAWVLIRTGRAQETLGELRSFLRPTLTDPKPQAIPPPGSDPGHARVFPKPRLVTPPPLRDRFLPPLSAVTPDIGGGREEEERKTVMFARGPDGACGIMLEEDLTPPPADRRAAQSPVAPPARVQIAEDEEAPTESGAEPAMLDSDLDEEGVLSGPDEDPEAFNAPPLPPQTLGDRLFRRGVLNNRRNKKP